MTDDLPSRHSSVLLSIGGPNPSLEFATLSTRGSPPRPELVGGVQMTGDRTRSQEDKAEVSTTGDPFLTFFTLCRFPGLHSSSEG